MLILKTLSNGAKHGYAITAHIQQVSDDLLRVEEAPCIPLFTAWSRTGYSDRNGRSAKATLGATAFSKTNRHPRSTRTPRNR